MSKETPSQKNNRPVTLAELQGFAKGILIDIPSPKVGEFIKVKVKRLDLTKELLCRPEVASFLSLPIIEKYKDNPNNKEAEKDIENYLNNELSKGDMDRTNDLMKLADDVCRMCLVEPTFKDFENTCGLTLEMKMSIFNWAFGETKDLVSFRNGG